MNGFDNGFNYQPLQDPNNIKERTRIVITNGFHFLSNLRIKAGPSGQCCMTYEFGNPDNAIIFCSENAAYAVIVAMGFHGVDRLKTNKIHV